ncbi:MAG TPA: cellulase family glycosylhydrolase [Ohtaekwangia sp.]
MNKIGIIASILACVVLALVITSCSKDDPKPAAELEVSTEQLTFQKEGEMKFFHLKSNVDWAVSSDEPWCTVNPSSGEAGTVKIEVTVVANSGAAERTATITVQAGNLSGHVTVTQSGGITVSEDQFDIAADEDEITIEVQSPGAYEVDIEGDWITPAEGSTTTSQKFDIAVNASLGDRTGTITFSSGEASTTVTITQAGQPLTIPADNTGMASNAVTLASKMTVGWNLGNTLEATSVTNGVYTASETMWGNPKTTKTLIDGIKAAGFNAVRLPCAWSGYIDNVETHHIKDSWLARVKEVIDYCVDNDMYVIINIHWDGGWLENNPVYSKQDAINEKQQALWEQIAVYFRNYDEHLLFAGTNEVHYDYGTPTTEHIAVQESFNQTFVDAVRSTGGRNATRNLVVQAYNTNISFSKTYMTMPEDAAGVTDRLMAEVHFYDPYEFTLQDPSTKYLWGADFAGSPNTTTWGQEAWVDEEFAIMKTEFVDNGIPVILGEYGAMLRSSLPEPALSNHIQSRNHYFNYVNKAAKLNGMITFYWDSGYTGDGGSGLFNRSTGAIVYEAAVNAIISAYD